ncbi:30S ribosomal protein S27e [Candidatus Micrarchaeota archaeon RBG_16_36_9]|nr:MAG: 30S ribosomal protein S27e [Candidatus Micrarchaeota archaeon RBG_16_36_9]
MEDSLKPKSKFLKVSCPGCKNEQIIYNKATSNVKCLVCGFELIEKTGGKAKIKSKVLQVF